jgi:hypothetical protein
MPVNTTRTLRISVWKERGTERNCIRVGNYLAVITHFLLRHKTSGQPGFRQVYNSTLADLPIPKILQLFYLYPNEQCCYQNFFPKRYGVEVYRYKKTEGCPIEQPSFIYSV